MESQASQNKFGFTDEEKLLFDQLIVASIDSLTQIINKGTAPNSKSLARNFAQATVSLASQIVIARRQEIFNVAAQEYNASLNKKGTERA